MSACVPVSLRTAVSIGMSSRSRTQLPRRSVACGRVAQLADVGAGVGETERAVLVDEELRDLVVVVVGEDRAHAQLEVGLVEREVEQRVERRLRHARRRCRRACARRARGARALATIVEGVPAGTPKPRGRSDTVDRLGAPLGIGVGARDASSSELAP